MLTGLEQIICEFFIEPIYSKDIYPKIAETIGNITNKVPFSITETAVYTALAGLACYSGVKIYKKVKARKENDALHMKDIWNDYKESFRKTKKRMFNGIKKFTYNIKNNTKETLKRVGIKTGKIVGITALSLTILGGAYLSAYEAVYGLNYYKVPLEKKLELHLEEPSQSELIKFGYHLVFDMNKDVLLMKEEKELSLDEVSEIMDKEVNNIIFEIDGIRIDSSHRVKKLLLEPYFTFIGAMAFTNPILHEIHYDTREIFVNEGRVIGHEVAHTKGYVRENEANFISYRACLNSGYAQIRYGAEQHLFKIILNNIESKQIRGTLEALLNKEAKQILEEDRKIAREKIEKSNKTLDRMYEQSMKAQGIEEGKKNYTTTYLLDIMAYYEMVGEL